MTSFLLRYLDFFGYSFNPVKADHLILFDGDSFTNLRFDHPTILCTVFISSHRFFLDESTAKWIFMLCLCHVVPFLS